VCLTRSRRVRYRTDAVHELPSPLCTLAVVTDMHHHTELSLVDEFRWVSPLRYLKNGWQNAVILWCMLQAGPLSLHHYCAVVHLSATLQAISIIVVNLQDSRAVFRIFIARLGF
jgi:hypothetical protein